MVSPGAIRAGRAFVAIGADDRDFRAALVRVRARLADFSRGLQAVGAGLLAAAGGTGAALAWPLRLAANLETASVAFETMLGDAAAAADLMDRLRQFAATTPFEFPELADAARLLIAFGSSTATVTDELRMIGDVAAGISAPIGELAELYGKMRINGRLMGEDLNQLAGRGIPILSMLADVLGVAESEVREMASRGLVTFEHLEEVFRRLTSSGGMFAGGMERQSRTLMGLWSTLRDNIADAVRPLGEQLLPLAKAAVTASTTLANRFQLIVTANREWATAVAVVAGGMAAAGAAALALGTGMGAVSIASFGITRAWRMTVGLLGAGVGLLTSLAAPAAVVGAALAAAHLAGVDLLGIVGRIAAALAGDFQTAATTATNAWRGIVAALSSGDVALAARLATAGLEVAWLEATASVRESIRETTQAARERWAAAVAWIAKAFVNLGANIRSAFATVATYIVGTVDLIGTKVAVLAERLKVLLWLADRDQADAAIERAEKEFSDRANARSASLQNQLDAIESAAADTFNVIDDMLRPEQVDMALDPALDAARRRLEAVRAELDEMLQATQAANSAAADKREQVKTRTAAAVASVGGFSAALAARNVQSQTAAARQTADNTKRVAVNTTKMLDQMGKGLTFA